MDIIYEIRRRHSVQKQTVTAIARDMEISRPTVRKYLNTVEQPKYERVQPASPKLGPFEEQLTQWLEEEAKLSRSRRRTACRLFEGLQAIGYGGAYDSVQRFVKRWKSCWHGPKRTEAFVPLLFRLKRFKNIVGLTATVLGLGTFWFSQPFLDGVAGQTGLARYFTN